MSGPSEQLLSGQGRNNSALDRDNYDAKMHISWFTLSGEDRRVVSDRM